MDAASLDAMRRISMADLTKMRLDHARDTPTKRAPYKPKHTLAKPRGVLRLYDLGDRAAHFGKILNED